MHYDVNTLSHIQLFKSTFVYMINVIICIKCITSIKKYYIYGPLLLLRIDMSDHFEKKLDTN